MAAEKQRLEEDVRRIRAMLRSALEIVDQRPAAPEQKAAEPTTPQPQQADAASEAGIRQVAG